MSNVMEYKGLVGKISYDAQDKIFYGEVIGGRTFLSFAGKSADELEQSFHESVDEYFEFCKEQGITPEKTWKGKLTFRPRTDELRQKIWLRATANNMSVNEWMNRVIESAVEQAL